MKPLHRTFVRLASTAAAIASAALATGCASAPTAPAAPAAPAECEIDYRVTVRHDTTPRRLEVQLSFPAEGRSETGLRLTGGWAGVDDFAKAVHELRGLDEATTVVAGDRVDRWRVAHPAKGRVRVAFEIPAALAQPDDASRPQDQDQQYRVQIGADWWRFFGYGALVTVDPWDDNRSTVSCITIAQPGFADPPVFGSHFAGKAATATTRVIGSPALMRHAFYAGGPGWRVFERKLDSGPVTIALRGSYEATDRAFVDKAAALIDTHRRFWGDRTSEPQSVVMNPNFSRYSSGGTVVLRSAVLFANTAFTPSNPSFESLIGHENLHLWIPQRLGRHSGDATGYWFSEGFTDYYTHRLLLASGGWTLEQYAGALTQALQGYQRSTARNFTAARIAPIFFSDRDAGRQMYSRGEILAAGWDRDLRARGKPGLDDVMRGLLLPHGSDERRSELAHERLLQALTNELGEQPRQGWQAGIVDGADLPLAADLLGPCFELSWADLPRWRLGFDESSYAARKAVGVVVDGPAWKAGLRDGMALGGWSVFGGDVTREVELTLLEGEATRKLRYLPVDGSERLPVVAVLPAKEEAPACRAWIRRP